MPLDAWALLIVSVGLGLGLEVAFVRAQRRRRADEAEGGRSVTSGKGAES